EADEGSAMPVEQRPMRSGRIGDVVDGPRGNAAPGERGCDLVGEDGVVAEPIDIGPHEDRQVVAHRLSASTRRLSPLFGRASFFRRRPRPRSGLSPSSICFGARAFRFFPAFLPFSSTPRAVGAATDLSRLALALSLTFRAARDGGEGAETGAN